MHRPGKRTQLKALKLSLVDIRRIYQRLSQVIDEEASRQLANIPKPENKSIEEFNAEKVALKSEAFRITVTISGRDGESLFGDDETVFSSPNLPGAISSVFMTNVVAYEGIAKQKPSNNFELFLDFSKPPLLDSKNFVSSPTPNNSGLVAEGDNDAWVASVFESIDGVVRHRRTPWGALHRGFVYDFGLIILGIPWALYVCAQSADFIAAAFGRGGAFLTSAAYIYIFFALLFGYRILFGYAKWAFPTLELDENRNHSTAHRIAWSTISLGILGNFAWESVKFLT